MLRSFRNQLKKVVKIRSELSQKQTIKDVSNRLVAHENPTLNSIGIALSETLDKELSEDELRVIEAIERRRRFLQKLGRKIEVIDFGAGSPTSNRTEKEMATGIRSVATVTEVVNASKPPFWALMLYKLIRKLGPSSCVELGSCVGISAAYQAAALQANGSGTVVTLEGSPSIADIAKETFSALNLKNVRVVTGPFTSTLNEVLEAAKPVGFFFNDGHHDHSAVLRYFNLALPFMSSTAVIVIDDISWSRGMRSAWDEIRQDKRVSASIDLKTMGVAVVSDRLSIKATF